MRNSFSISTNSFHWISMHVPPLEVKRFAAASLRLKQRQPDGGLNEALKPSFSPHLLYALWTTIQEGCE